MDERETAFVHAAARAPLRRHAAGAYVLLASVGFVLLIACVNVANLELAPRHRTRTRGGAEAALGASTRVIVRQLLIENVLLAFVSGVAGVVLASWALPALVALAPATRRR